MIVGAGASKGATLVLAIPTSTVVGVPVVDPLT